MSHVIDDALAAVRAGSVEIIGDQRASFRRAATIWDAVEGDIAFCTARRVPNPVEVIGRSQASVIIADKAVASLDLDAGRGRALVIAENPEKLFVDIICWAFPAVRPASGVHPSALVAAGAEIHETAHVGAHCVLGRCAVGAHSVIHPNVTINDGVSIGEHVTVFPGTVIGYDGFGHAKDDAGVLRNSPHLGGVVIEDNVEIGSNTSIDRGSLGNTIIKAGAKIDNLVHIAHNVVIGENAMVIAHAMVGGSATVGANAWVAPGALIRDALRIGDKAVVGLGAVVTKDVPDGSVVVGNPARLLPPKT